MSAKGRKVPGTHLLDISSDISSPSCRDRKSKGLGKEYQGQGEKGPAPRDLFSL